MYMYYRLFILFVGLDEFLINANSVIAQENQ